MAKQDTSTATPKLRFLEFRAAPVWSVKPMNGLYTFMRNNTLSRDKLNYESGGAKNVHYGDIHTKFSALFDITKENVPYVNSSEEIPGIESEDYCIEGDLIFADASEDTNDVGKSIEIVRLAGEQLLSGQHTILARRKDNTLIVGFGGHLFRSGLIRSRIEKEAQGTKVYQISSSRLGGIDITFPGDRAEQQKISACLTSLDEVIAAQGRKVEALKTHKRGLMQQLFPREGETLPRLRFVEYRDAPDWYEKSFGRIYDFMPTNIFSRNQLNYAAGTVKNIHYGDIHTKFSAQFRIDSELVPFVNSEESLGKIKPDAYCREGDMVFADASEDLRDVGKSIELVGLNGEKLLSGSHTILARQREADLVLGFGGYLFKSCGVRAQIEKEAHGTKVMSISPSRLAGIAVRFPADTNEQQRIADCLSSLDTQIAAESNQLAALKTHKQGLMQQLFPVPEATGA